MSIQVMNKPSNLTIEKLAKAVSLKENEDGLELNIPAQSDIQDTCVISANSKSEKRLRIIAGNESKASLIIRANGGQIIRYELELGTSAELNITIFSENSDGQTDQHGVLCKQAKNSKVNITLIGIGNGRQEYEINTTNLGEKTQTTVKQLILSGGSAQSVSNIRLNHEKGDSISRQKYIALLFDKSRSDVTGLVYVHKGAQLTDSEQSYKNILLSDDARAKTEPQLEIFADDVVCAHGATVGQLDDEELFYLNSRGLSMFEAKKIVLSGLCSDLLNSLPEDTVSEEIQTRVDTVLEKCLHESH